MYSKSSRVFLELNKSLIFHSYKGPQGAVYDVYFNLTYKPFMRTRVQIPARTQPHTDREAAQYKGVFNSVFKCVDEYDCLDWDSQLVIAT